MRLANSYLELLAYKLRYVGLRNTVRVGYLDVSEHLLYQISKRFPSVSVSPRSIQIECTTKCNLKCTFCELSYWTEKPADLKFENIRKMVEHLPKLKRIDLTGIGECLMNREFFEIVAFLKARGMYVTLNDNFTLMSEQTARRIIELQVDQIFLSLDGATKQTYEQLRVGANFDKVIANARRLVHIKSDLGKRRPEVKINTVVCLTNHHELPAIVELAHEMGIGMVQFVNVITFDDTTSLDTERVGRDVRKTFKETVQRARRLGVLVKIELFDKMPVQECDFPWKRNFATYDGYVHPCCYTTQTGDRKAQNHRSFGNLVEHSFEEMWKGQSYPEFRSKMGKGVLPYQCEHCPKYIGRHDVEARKVMSRAPVTGTRIGSVMEPSKTQVPPKVGVVVLNYNGKALAERCLQSVMESSYANKEIILVDNASTDGSVEYLRTKFPDVLVVENPENLGVAGGRNCGFREAIRRGNDYILSLDNDARIDGRLIEELVEVAESDPRIGVIGPKTYFDDGSGKIQCAGGRITYTQNVCSERGSGEIDRGQYDRIDNVDYFPGFGFMARREVFERLTFLDETFYGYGHEDSDFCKRAARMGYRVVYVPQAVMWHRGSTTIGGYSPKKKYLEAVNSAYFVRKYGTPKDCIKYAFFAGFGLVYALVVQSFEGNHKAVFAKARGIWDGLRRPLS